MYVPWIHGNEPVPEWWKAFVKANDAADRAGPPMWFQKRMLATARSELLWVMWRRAGGVQEYVTVSWPTEYLGLAGA